MKKLLLLSLSLITLLQLHAQLSIRQLRTENLTDPLGVETLQPRFSWQLASSKRGTMQTACEIRVANTVSDLIKGRNLVWQSGRMQTDASVHVEYAGPAPKSGQRLHWQVRVWDNQGQVSPWSTPAFWQTALFKTTDWSGQWISPGFTEPTTDQPSPYLRKAFRAGKKISSATAYITALGMYEARINGQRISDALLTPGWTAYNKRVQYQTYDVTSMLRSGDNVIGAVLGNGWYRGFIGFPGQNNVYGKGIALLFQLDIEYTDGSRDRIASDDTWKCADGEIRA